MHNRRWQLAPPAPPDFHLSFPEINGILLQLLYNRGLRTQAEIDEFLNPDYGEDIHDPMLLEPMGKAVERICQAIERGERMLVYGDYDADGVCGAALLVSALEALGAAPGIYLPFRETEGYGLNAAAADEIIGEKYQLVLTVDCGISNLKEIEQLQRAGVDVVVTDHHNPPEIIPPAFAVIDPKITDMAYPYRDLAGTGVAFKLAQALFSQDTRAHHPKIKFPTLGFEKWLLDLVAIGTIADLCEMIGENRTLVHYGLTVLRKSRRLGVRALVDVAGIALDKVDTQAIGFALGPRLNAAGRMNHASSAYKLLVAKDPEQARELAGELDEQNRRRQQMTDTIRQAARKQVMPVGKQKLLCAVGEDWPIGLIGLVAGRLTDEFQRPAIAISRNEKGKLVGSGRSVHGFNITAALAECREHVSRFGGHFYACGFTVKSKAHIEPLRRKLEKLAASALTDEQITGMIPVDCEIDLSEVTFALQEELQKLEPYGQGNPRPRFVSRGLSVSSVQPVGNNGKHLRLMVGQHGHPAVVKLIGFSIVDRIPKIAPGDVIDVIFEVDINQWNGNRELQLKIVDVKKIN
ncbi:MAG: single-stranded-DNA-specific exonuclease RecJ [Patescibacteria group bacterium]|nr:single-stranded-DNA-specific exonuclease RecJ [Patescibacteria group bacterium]